VVVGIRMSATLAGTQICDYLSYNALSIDPSSIFNPSGTSKKAQIIAVNTILRMIQYLSIEI
jgi:hypothetical protein